MDRELLASRNRQLADAFHQAPMRHHLRHFVIRAVAHIPILPLPSRVQRVLFIRPDHIGDVLLATPAMRALKQAHPKIEIHALVGAWSASILANVDEIDQVLTLPFPGFDRNQLKRNPLAPYQQLIRVSRQLRRIGYTSVVIMRPDHWWGAMLAYVAGIKERIGYNLPDVSPFLTNAIQHRHEHVVRQNMRLVETWLTHPLPDKDIPFFLTIDPNAQETLSDLLIEWRIPKHAKIICVHAGAGTWAKQWEVAKWAHVAQTLIEQTDSRIIFTGTGAERAMITQIQNRISHTTHNSAGELSLDQLTALYARSAVVIGADSGPLHIASAVGTPTVSLFGPADPAEFGQWGDRRKHRILTSNMACRPCRVLDWGDDTPSYHPCVREIGVGEVLEATRSLLNASRE